MRPELAALARKHAMPPELLHELDALWSGRSASAVTLLEGYEPVELSAEGELRAIPDPTTEDTDETALIAGRYVDLGPIGVGGMGEVRRVRDVALNRILAMKTMHPGLVGRSSAMARFVAEAQATAQLQHPGIVPVHDLGVMPDGRIWFAMKEVRGRTLAEVIREVHAASVDRWETAASGWTFRRIVAAFMQACHAVSYAHERGVVHRDLKPDNVMVGTHGEVLVLDWGLAKVVGRPDPARYDLAGDEGNVVTARTDADATHMGTVAGTPVYMAPEQARGELDRIDARTDVYALGAVLYEILCGRPPYAGASADVLAAVRAGPPPPVERARVDDGSAPGPRPPDDLVGICRHAMAREREDRLGSARALATEIEAWIDGVRRQEQALEVVRRALTAAAEAEGAVASGAALRAEAEALLAGVPPWASEEQKAPGWSRAEEADAAELEARLRQLDVDEALLAALQISPGLPEAHAAMASRSLARHSRAEEARDPRTAAEIRIVLETHAVALPDAHPLRTEVAEYLKGDGALTLVTDPPGAEVSLYRFVERNRRLVEVFERSLGTTPLQAVPLEMGSYVCVLRHPACDLVRYPVEIHRRAHWDGVAPGEHAPHAVWLPPRGMLGPDEVCIPAGWFRAGGDPEVASLPRMRAWCDGFVVHRFPVTHHQYTAYLDDLAARGDEALALRSVPTDRGHPVYTYADGRFSIGTDIDGDAMDPAWPVVYVDWRTTRAFFEHLAQRTGRPWRLPWELEWEKAARGVDGRFHPWGNRFDASWCRVRDTSVGRPLPATVDQYPVDVSVYGVRGMAGNVHDWCLDGFDEVPSVVGDRFQAPDLRVDPPENWQCVVRGGAYSSPRRATRSALRIEVDLRLKQSDIGVRGLYRLPAPEARRP